MEATHMQTPETASAAPVITPKALLEHWQGHRRLTRRVIEAFPEEAFFHFSVGGMRPFAALVTEMIGMAGPGMVGIATREWPPYTPPAKPGTKAEALQQWDEVTRQINQYWPQIPPGRFQEHDVAFGVYAGLIYSHVLYFIDNEVHHRGQGYVYLRALGIEPPPFWQRD
jgi:uncharacterized damage-inducible protein DinB